MTTDLLKPILKTMGEQPMTSDMQQVLTIHMVHDPETLKNELVEDEPLPKFEKQTLEAGDTLTTGEQPAMHQFFYPLSCIKGKMLQLTSASCSLVNKVRCCHILELVNNYMKCKQLSKVKGTITYFCSLGVPAARISRAAFSTLANTMQLHCEWEQFHVPAVMHHMWIWERGNTLIRWNSKVAHGKMRYWYLLECNILARMW